MHQGLFINLDRSADRRRHMESTLASLGLSHAYQRVPAVDGRALNAAWSSVEAGAKGCFLSHVEALKRARSFAGVTHVLEDDVILNPFVPIFLNSTAASAALSRFDIVFLSLWIDYPALPGLVGKRRSVPKGEYQSFDAREARISSTDSYIVSQSGAEKLHTILEAAGPIEPVDNMLQRLTKEGKIAAGFVLPFVTAVDPRAGANSSIVRITPQEYELLTIARRLVYVDETPVEWPARDTLAPSLQPSLDFLKLAAAQPVGKSIAYGDPLTPFSLGFT